MLHKEALNIQPYKVTVTYITQRTVVSIVYTFQCMIEGN